MYVHFGNSMQKSHKTHEILIQMFGNEPVIQPLTSVQG